MIAPLATRSKGPLRLGLLLGLAVMLVLARPGLVTAQTQTSVGVVGGVNSYDWQEGPQLGSAGSAIYNAEIGFFFGGAFALRFAEKWGARIEAFYDNNRTMISATDQDAKVQYIRIPVLAEFWLRFSPNHDNYLRISGGPSVGFNIGCSVGDVGCDDLPPGDPIAPSLTDITMLGTIAVTAGPAVFEIRYNLGLRNLNRIANGPNLKTREYMFAINYFFTLKPGGQWF